MKLEAGSASRPINRRDFRDHLSTADRHGHRQWVFPKKPHGRFYRYRSWVSWLLLAVMFIGPFVRINGNPLLLFNIVERRFSIFGQIFWPHDTAIFAVALLLFGTSIFIFTAAFGRLWCGWTCPQTLLMEMVFRRIEYLIEGDAAAQRALHAAPWTRRKITRKAVKHFIFFALSFVIGNTLLSYVIGVEQLFRIMTDDPRKHVIGLAFMLLFTAVFYLIFARFREQACTFICPYGRLQSTVVDENTLVVAYDYRRGEMRGPLRRPQTPEQRKTLGLGDCVNCFQCVAVCPTGIDIRNGTQMECINCTACMDACDAVMDRIGRPRGLIRYASLDSIEQRKPFRFTPRLAGYTAVLLALAAVLVFLLATRSPVESVLLRAPGALFQQTADGRLQNLYLFKVINKTSHEIPVTLRPENVGGLIQVMGRGDLTVPRADLAQTSVLVQLVPEQLIAGKARLVVGVYSNGKRIETVETTFVGPRNP